MLGTRVLQETSRSSKSCPEGELCGMERRLRSGRSCAVAGRAKDKANIQEYAVLKRSRRRMLVTLVIILTCPVLRSFRASHYAWILSGGYRKGGALAPADVAVHPLFVPRTAQLAAAKRRG